MDNLAVEDGGAMYRQRSSNGSRQRGERLEGVPVARDEPRGAVLDVRQGAEAVRLQLKEPVGMIEWRVQTVQTWEYWRATTFSLSLGDRRGGFRFRAAIVR